MTLHNKHWRTCYAVRLAACMAASLLLITVAFNLPLHRSTKPARWSIVATSGMEPLGLLEIGADAAPLLPITATSASDIDQSPVVHETSPQAELVHDSTDITEDTRHMSTLSQVEHMSVVDFVDEMPQVKGGLAAYYIHIEYPDEARRRGIEGRLTLGFVVEPDGSTSDVRVMESLHPLCDSAAVDALRKTSFISGQHQGRTRRVRMRLPVKFMLVSPDSIETATI